MKKLVAAVFVGFILVSALSAQVTVGARGILALNLGSKGEKEFFGSNPDMEVLVGGGGGVFIRYNLPSLPALGLQLDMSVLANNGIKGTLLSSSLDVDAEASYTSLELPVLITCDFPVAPQH